MANHNLHLLEMVHMKRLHDNGLLASCDALSRLDSISIFKYVGHNRGFTSFDNIVKYYVKHCGDLKVICFVS